MCTVYVRARVGRGGENKNKKSAPGCGATTEDLLMEGERSHVLMWRVRSGTVLTCCGPQFREHSVKAVD